MSAKGNGRERKRNRPVPFAEEYRPVKLTEKDSIHLLASQKCRDIEVNLGTLRLLLRLRLLHLRRLKGRFHGRCRGLLLRSCRSDNGLLAQRCVVRHVGLRAQRGLAGALQGVLLLRSSSP